MKNLHKKIGAMFLAGMVVLGGVAAGGVNSFAASSKANKVVASSKIGEEHQIRKVKFACKLLKARVISYNKAKVKEDRSMGNRVYKLPNDNLELNLYNLQNRNKGKIVNIQYRGIIFSIEFNK